MFECRNKANLFNIFDSLNFQNSNDYIKIHHVPVELSSQGKEAFPEPLIGKVKPVVVEISEFQKEFIGKSFHISESGTLCQESGA